MSTVIEVIGTAITAAEAYHRDDLAARLRQSRARALSPEVRVLVAGGFKQGKSRLVNALVGASACPVADDTTPPRTTVVRYAGTPGPAPAARPADTVEIGLPSGILRGLTLVDSPVLEPADAILIVSDASGPCTQAELDMIDQARALAPIVVCVLSKVDLYPGWRDVAESTEAATGLPVVPVSSELRWHAMTTADTALNDESGFPALIAVLRAELDAERVTRRVAAHEVLAATGDLTATMTAEVAALRAADAEQRGIRWQQVLNDGISDLIADIDHDLRDRLRDVLKVAEAELDAVDPAKVGDDFAEWLRGKEAQCTAETFEWMVTRARWLAGHVAEQFGDDHALPEIRRPGELAVGDFEPAAGEKFGVGQRLIVGMRGGYGGTLMIGMASTIVGVAMINPLSIGAGLLLGGKTVQEERKRLLQRRQAESKAALRKHVDDVIFQAGKQSRDMLREIQRTLRDHFVAHAEDVHRALVDAAAERKTRIRDLNAELARVRDLERVARELVA
ncbi:hypothetical protein [Kibdelosporangium phytohabitans]|uniref:Isoniazid-inducible protein iniA n=1 Tax=Kibdelosporangium phytohabitans TaxID=860235 RepID=A0A0N7F429_9PSEU|nr:hypothetical protein [Kibdelosporangium phytohabitans]ALG10279.1 hypothetical protein AOZ06_28315 [Kibdelosporangium phytohabitans]MBE1461309.1 hypothetical protein [Kibdelosporangium phytohabitans]